ncbi:TIR disease resistance protein [Quillaja saponaria]|uniref:TIR disease resistance protein n=1 Tax=Quillaja saponaria TaxID=32244 RepID=A0AAD7LPF5_QUISA|nr:TIR disease resistance protein [Quillaja saponaria]
MKTQQSTTRGIDTRNSFTGASLSALSNAGINTFIDDSDLPRGKDIELRLLQAIEGSRVSLIVFSIHYADSRWCLDELKKIMECRRTANQVVLPIFYKVELSDVQNRLVVLLKHLRKMKNISCLKCQVAGERSLKLQTYRVGIWQTSNLPFLYQSDNRSIVSKVSIMESFLEWEKNIQKKVGGFSLWYKQGYIN